MTERERFAATLRREKIGGRVPHFELVFFLTMESIGKVHPAHRVFSQWDQMSRKEQRLQTLDIAHAYVDIAEKYHHSAIFVQAGPCEGVIPTLEAIREISGDKYFVMLHGDPTWPIPDGDSMMDFSVRLYEDMDALKEESRKRMEEMERGVDAILKHKGLLDGICMCSDYCFNTNPFYSREVFADLISPYLSGAIQMYHDRGLYAIKHTDGNIMPIVDLMVECKPDALHSLDPQGGVSLTEVMKTYGDRVCCIGNVNCGLLQTGTPEEAEADVRRALKEGMAFGKGYVFSSSNCVYTGLDLERYERMHDIWYQEGIYRD